MSEKIKAVRGNSQRSEAVVTWLEEHGAKDAKHQVEGSYEYKMYFVDPNGDALCIDKTFEFLFDVEELPIWRAQENETYYWVSDWGLVLEKIEERTYSDEAHYKVGNYFRTKEEALEVCSKIVELLKERK